MDTDIRTATQIADGVRAGDLSAADVLEHFLERIEAHNPSLNAIVHLDASGARAQAERVDAAVKAGRDPGPFAGVPLAVKDLEDVAGMPTTYGSLVYSDNIAQKDATHVARLRAAGAVIVGKSASPEFGAQTWTTSRLFGITRNPWNLDRTPGGSSGGSAAAVGAGLLPICTASDGGGSIRIPCSYTGLPGLKPTFGRIPHGAGPDSSQTGVLGCAATTVRDIARWFDVVAGPDEKDQFSLPKPPISYESVLGELPAGLRAAWTTDFGFGRCAAEVAAITQEAAGRLASAAGITITDLAVELEDPWTAWGALGIPGSIRRRAELADRIDDLTPVVRLLFAQAADESAAQRMADGHRLRWENNQRLAAIFEQVDVILSPTTPTTAFGADGPLPLEIDGISLMPNPQHSLTGTYPFNVSGHPAITLPCGLDAAGLPVGLQVVTRRQDEHVLLQIAAAFERAEPWPRLAPGYDP